MAERIFLIGGTGTIGAATARELVARGHAVTGLARRAGPPGVDWRIGEVTDPVSIARDGFRGERFDGLVSCLASRTGVPDEAWAVDHRAHSAVLAAARQAGVGKVVLLSAICVQRPKLAFQFAKLAFEAELRASGIDHSIVRPTAYFKSLTGQLARVRAGKPYLIFGDGRLTACKPISDADLARYLADCLDRKDRRNRVLPIGGPGLAMTPRAQGEELFRLLGREPRFRSVPVALLDGIAGGLGALGRFAPGLRSKAELARIGRYYATESMLVWDEKNSRYDADLTPSFGTDTLSGHLERLILGEVADDRGAHAVF